MNVNANSRFSVTPSVDIGRSRFDRSFTHKTTFSGGDLIPIFLDECLPGDSVTMDLSSLVRMSTPIFPTMDNAWLDVYFFFIPNRLLWTHWKEFMGENTSSYWTPITEYNVPITFSPPDVGFDKGSVADYMGVPTNVPRLYLSSLPFRAYALVWNEWFRDQNTMQPAFIEFGDVSTYGVTRADSEINAAETAGIPYADAARGGMPLPVCRYHDYFSSALPQPQRGAAVEIPLFNDEVLPVTSLEVSHGFESGYAVETNFTAMGVANSVPLYATSRGIVGDASAQKSIGGPDVEFTNLAVDLQNVTAGTIIQLRQAFQIQKLLEADARGGARYRELIYGHFGVVSPDSRMQVPEYLGGKRIPLNIDQVLQTSETTENSPQGNTAAFSLTTDVSSMFTKSFTEHGWILGLAAVRNAVTYQQGLNKMWSRRRRYDFYWPELANLSESPIYRQQIWAVEGAGNSYDPTGSNYEVFGYQEAWSEYKYAPSIVTSSFRSNYQTSLDAWHYADYYEGDASNFTLNAEWMKSPAKQDIDRTLAVQSDVEDQFIADFFFKSIWTRPMPMYSIPGLADHH